MLRVFICEDNSKHLAMLRKIISDYIEDYELKMYVAISTPSPKDILEYLPSCTSTGLYFLDLDLDCDIDGFELAKSIREYDPRAFIVIVTSDSSSRMNTFKYTLEVMDYITKDSSDFNERIEACMKNAYNRYASGIGKIVNIIEIKVSEDIVNTDNLHFYSQGCIVKLESIDVLFVECISTNPRHVYIHTDNAVYVTRMRLKDVLKQLGGDFVQVHKSCIVNKSLIASIAQDQTQLKLINGKEIEVSRRYRRRLKN